MNRYLRLMTEGLGLIVILLLTCGGCGRASLNAHGDPSVMNGPAPVLISVISDMNTNPQAVDMAMKFAGFALDESREVFMFFNVKGVSVPSSQLTDDAAFQENAPVKEQLAQLIERGAKVHVCPVCMKALDVTAADLMTGAEVTNRAALFGAIERGTCVFTY